MALRADQGINLLNLLKQPIPVFSVLLKATLRLQDRGNQVNDVFPLANATGTVAIVAIIADHLFSLVRDMRCHGRQPFEGIEDLLNLLNVPLTRHNVECIW